MNVDRVITETPSLIEDEGGETVKLLVQDKDSTSSEELVEVDPEAPDQVPIATATPTSELFGLLWMALSAFAFSVMSMLVNVTSNNDMKFPSFELVLARSLVQMTLSALYMLVIVKKIPFGPSDVTIRRLLVLRGTSGSVGLAFFYYGLTVLSLSDAIVIFFIGPTLTAILAHLVLNESLDAVDIFSSVSCLIGVVLVARPNFLFGGNDIISEPPQSEIYRGLAVAALLAGAAMSAVAYVTVRKITSLSSEVHTMTHVFYFGLISSIFSPICLFSFQTPVVPTTGAEIGALFAVGIFAFVGQILLNRGLQLAPAGPGTIMRNLDIVFAFLFGIIVSLHYLTIDIFLLHKIPRWTSYVGASIILFFTCLVGYRRWMKRQR